MHPVTVDQVIPHYGDVPVIIATDASQRLFAGLGTQPNENENFVFIEIDRVTLLELERGSLDLYTVMTERCIGMVFESPAVITAACPVCTGSVA
jgi:hypothetical protein